MRNRNDEDETVLSKAQKSLLLLAMVLLVGTLSARAATPSGAHVKGTQFKYENVGGVRIFYREAGEENKTTIVLLHGFPSSSHMFRDLIPLLSTRFHVIAPDYPGFGYSDMPSPENFEYSFDHLSQVTESFLEQKHATKFFVYLQDYGGPVGYRIAVRHPNWIQGLIIQNANAYGEGISPALKSLLEPIWLKRDAKTEAQVLKMFELDNTKFQYQEGARDKDAMNPDAWTLDQTLLDRPGNKLIQLELQATYKTNPERYPEWHRYFREHQPPALIVWGKGDPIFTERGALAYKNDLRDLEIHFYNTGHFALEEDVQPISAQIAEFVERKRK